MYRSAFEKWNIDEADGIIIPMIDARRTEVYMAAYDRNGEKVINDQAFILDEGELVQKINTDSKVLVTGDASEKAKDHLIAESFEFLPLNLEADLMSALSEEKYQSSSFEDLAYSVPDYIKPPNIVASKKKYF